MPSLTFVMPHWLYWSGLVLFPLIAAYFAHRQDRKGTKPGVSLPIAYLLLVTAGFVGLHRFYLRVYYLPFAYIGLFVLILYGNRQGASARVEVSNAKNTFLGAEFDVERAQKALAEGAQGAAEKLAEAQQTLEGLQLQLATANALWDQWQLFPGLVGAVTLTLLIVDAILLPRLTRRCAEREAREGREYKDISHTREAPAKGSGLRVHSAFTDFIDRISGWSGHFVCYWSMIAVFVYYYEVLARYVFNSPTNWAHEGMFLMFGMQYLLAGAFALREDSHVRVDVLYLYFPDRIKALVDVVTSLFFFLFTVALLWTGWIFTADAIEVWEVSFTEWAIQYWPVKATLAIGGFLIILQGIAKLFKDITILAGKET
ncbi:MAG: TRAP transporter small permease subunit [SAR324 cluster bacterium]|nr:TRAP transporter small permease subunit [SAR324 cluster bacterium]